MSSQSIASLRNAHIILGEFKFDIKKLERGYANRTLRIDLDTHEITIHPVSKQMKDLWIGGKGFDLWLMLQEISKDTKWDSNENPICFATGPLGGTTSFPGSGKTLITTISPATHSVMDSNVGGHFGPYFKFAGFDAITIVGKAQEDVIILIDSNKGKITIEKAPLESLNSHLLAEELTAMYADNEIDRKNIAVVSAGQGADHTYMGILNFSFWDWRRNVARLKQAGRGGIGTVFRDKKIKAIVVKNSFITPAWRIQENKVAPLITPKTIPDQTSQSDRNQIRKIISRWNNDPEFIIEMMQDIQDTFRFISKTALDALEKQTKTPKAYIYHIATFYKSFSLQPKGEVTIQICQGTACHVSGAANIISAFERHLKIKAGETTPDNQYTLEIVRCLGACSIAPVIKIGDKIIGQVKAHKVEKILKDYKENLIQDIATEERCSCSSEKIGRDDLFKIAQNTNDQRIKYKALFMVCTGTGCNANDGQIIKDTLQNTIKAMNLSPTFQVIGTGCNGLCAQGPNIIVQPEGVFYSRVKLEDIEELVESHCLKGKPLTRLMYQDPINGEKIKTISDIPFYARQHLLTLKNQGVINPEDINDAIAQGGYQSLHRALTTMKPEEVIREVIKSGIRGRGGGGFPTGIKWQSGTKAAQDRSCPIYIVCNADEGDPGAFIDGYIMETDPHSVIEGMLIGAYAVGAREGFIYIRKEYPLASKRLMLALSQAYDRGLLGKNILNSDFDFNIHVHRGAGAFVCGESTALMASMAGKVGEPRAKYVHNVEYGFRNKPTILNNVETWASIPTIIKQGAQWFASIGTGEVSKNPWNGSSGTKAFSLVGAINNVGLIEVPMGITLREIIYDIGGGILQGRKFKAIQTGGPSGGCLPESKLDLPVDFDSLAKAGSMMGSGGMIVMDDRTCMVDVAKYFITFLLDESCGKCTACREGLFALHNILTRICKGQGQESDIRLLEEVADTISVTSLCQLGGTAVNPVLSTLQYFKDEYEQHVNHQRCPAGVCKPLITYTINSNCTGCQLCAKNCPTNAITGSKNQLHVVTIEQCCKCSICFETCKFNAVEVR